MAKPQFHAIVWKEGKLYVAKCVELELASQGYSRKEALLNLKEALSLYFEGEDINHLPYPKPKDLKLIRVSLDQALYA